MAMTYLLAGLLVTISTGLGAIMGAAQANAIPGLLVDAVGTYRHVASVEPETVQGCLNCHREALSLGQQTRDQLAAQIRSILAGSLAHPVPLPEFGDAEIVELAELLTDE